MSKNNSIYQRRLFQNRFYLGLAYATMAFGLFWLAAGTPETTGQSETEITPTGQPETAQTASEPADSEPPATQPETATEPTEKPKRGKGDKAE